jgi:hypothetical protein
LATIGSVTVHLLTASGKREFVKDSAGFPDTQHPRWGKEIAKPAGSTIADRQEIAVYQDDATAVSTAKCVIFGLTQSVYIAS